MMRLVTFVAGTEFLAAAGAAMFLAAGTVNLPSIWLYLAPRMLFTAACVVTMSEDVARERLKPSPDAKPEPVYNIESTIAWISHVVIVALDLGRFGWSTGFLLWLQVVGVVIMLAGMSLVVWALRHNEYLSARFRTPAARVSAGSAWRRRGHTPASAIPTAPVEC